MVWVCPTLGRPERLQRLAKSWERNQPRTPLHVRLWRDDPLKEEYKKGKWPKTWNFYESEIKYLSPSLNEFALEYRPGCDTYGFIADDIVLRTPGGLEHLAALAEPCYFAYPNDTIQRARLGTHFCVGGELVREVGWFGHPDVLHSVDVPWTSLAKSAGLARYAPFVVFDHVHYLKDPSLYDATYGETYPPGSQQPETDMYRLDIAAIDEYFKSGGLLEDTKRVFSWIHSLAEDPEEWAAQDRADALVVATPGEFPTRIRADKGSHHAKA